MPPESTNLQKAPSCCIGENDAARHNRGAHPCSDDVRSASEHLCRTCRRRRHCRPARRPMRCGVRPRYNDCPNASRSQASSSLNGRACSRRNRVRGIPLGKTTCPRSFVDEFEEFLAGGALQFLLVECAVIVWIGGLELFSDDRCVLFRIERAVIVGISCLDTRRVETP